MSVKTKSFIFKKNEIQPNNDWDKLFQQIICILKNASEENLRVILRIIKKYVKK